MAKAVDVMIFVDKFPINYECYYFDNILTSDEIHCFGSKLCGIGSYYGHLILFSGCIYTYIIG